MNHEACLLLQWCFCNHCDITFENTSKYVDTVTFYKTWTKGHWPQDDLWPQVCWGHMCDSTQGSLCPSPTKIHQSMWIQWPFCAKTWTKGHWCSLTLWPLTPCLLRSHVWLYLRIIVSKSHINKSKYVDTVTLFSKTWTKSHWPLDDLWPHVCWGQMCDSTQGSLCKSHGNTSMFVDTVINFAKLPHLRTYYIHTEHNSGETKMVASLVDVISVMPKSLLVVSLLHVGCVQGNLKGSFLAELKSRMHLGYRVVTMVCADGTTWLCQIGRYNHPPCMIIKVAATPICYT